MLSLHEANGYEEFISPLLVKRESLFGTGHLPKFAAEIFSSDRELFLIPTSEVNLVSQFKNRIFSFEELPKKLVSFSPCFRKEAGAAGKLSHGLLRMHQFLKVELVKLVSEESEEEEFRELLSSATEVLKKLKLPHRVIRLGKKELSFSAAEGFDIEV